SLRLDDVLRTLADLGAGYGEAVEVLRRAERLQCLSCRVVVDALPQATSVYDLAKAGARDPELLQTHPEILEAKADFGATPTLFEKDEESGSRPASRGDSDRPRKGKTEKAAATPALDASSGGLQ